MSSAMRQSVRGMEPGDERSARASNLPRPHRVSGPLECKTKPPNEGFLLLDRFLRPIYASPGAMEILYYPESTKKIRSLNGHLSARVQSLLISNPASPRSGFADEFLSGRRRYSCRAFSLNAGSNHSGEAQKSALLLERSRKLPPETLPLVEQFNLTRRERETIENLVHGLSNKEIADRMKISSSTVKVFLRLIMTKMGTTTRLGIMGKILSGNR